MAERNTAKSKRLERAATPSKSGGAKVGGVKADAVKSASPTSAAAKVAGAAAAAAENVRLRAELDAARERIADLELRQTEITNRIAWVIDSLHNLPE